MTTDADARPTMSDVLPTPRTPACPIPRYMEAEDFLDPERRRNAPTCRRARNLSGESCDDHASIPEAGPFIGITYRQVDYWTRVGYLRPEDPLPGTGKARVWPAGEIAVAALIRRLTAAGVELRAAARVAREQAEVPTGRAVLRGGIVIDLDHA